MAQLPDAPDVETSYGAKLWPTSSAPSGRGGPERPTSFGSRTSKRSIRTATVIVLLLAVWAFAFAAGFGVADSRAQGAIDSSAPITSPSRTYEEGLQAGQQKGYEHGFRKGTATGFKAGKQRGYENGYAKGQAAGREAGYATGYAQGKSYGHRTGMIEGCEAVFDALKTNRVIDRPAGPYQKYWYLTRDKCESASTLGS